MKIKFFFLLITLVSFRIFAQNDTEFWFAFPSTDDQYAVGGTSTVAQDISLRICASAQTATVSVTFPAAPSYNSTFTVQANSIYTYQIVSPNSGSKSKFDFINPYPSETFPQNNGMHITSTTKITAYILYGFLGNANIFTLKGRHAIGKSFFLPFQTKFNPGGVNFSTSKAYASFSIVATTDNTIVQVTPTKDLIGHAANIPFNIMLNKGQTFTGFSPQSNITDCSNQPPGNQPVGTIIDATSPVALTIATDLALSMQCSVDMEGDQIIPVDQLGAEYIVFSIRTGGPNPYHDDYLVFVATANNTKIILSNGQTKTLNKGESWMYQWTGNIYLPQPVTMSIKADKPIYCYQAATVNNELTGALIPPLQNTGLNEISLNLSNVPLNNSNPIYRLFLFCPESAISGFTVTLFKGMTNQNFSNITFKSISGKPGYKGGVLEINMNNYTQFPDGNDVGLKVTNPNLFTLGLTSSSGSGSAVSAVFTDYIQPNVLKDTLVAGIDKNQIIVDTVIMSYKDTCFLDYTKPLDTFYIKSADIINTTIKLTWVFKQGQNTFEIISSLEAANIKSGYNLFIISILCNDGLKKGLHTNTFVAPFTLLLTQANDLIKEEQIKIYPNPFSIQTIFSMPTNDFYTLIITDIQGRQVKQFYGLRDKKIKISSEGMQTGLYFYTLTNQATGQLYNGKLIITK